MIIAPRFKGFICTTAHPQGCEENVIEQINYVKNHNSVEGPKNVLIIGASTGYGLASRIMSTFGSGASTIGVMFERPASERKTASPGWYNTAAFERIAGESGFYSRTINGDAFSNEVKEKTIKLIKEDLGKVDLVIYSIASPKRIHPVTGEIFSSVLKPVRKPYKNKTVDFHNYQISEIEIQPASEDEIRQTVAVMGGEDWQLWIDALMEADVLSEGAVTMAYSYIGPDITYPIYRHGTIGKAKEDLEVTAERLNKQIEKINGKALVVVNKALVTQASAAIPVLPLYIAVLYKVMKEKGIHEGCIEQIYRLYAERIYSGDLQLDERGRIRIDDLETREDVQKIVSDTWDKITTDNIKDLTDITGYRNEFFKLFGFGYSDIDYSKDINPDRAIPDLY